MKSAAKSVLDSLGVRFERMSPDERLLRRGYDPRRPPPAEDVSYLRPSNPRLEELHQIYGSVSSPVGARSLWAGGGDPTENELAYFRGDNLFLWQYTRSARLNRYRNFIHGRYVQAVDDLGLLGRLREDGAFGCLTFDYTGMPTLSRDLLDSVNEINFLERHLGILSAPARGVLDVGAGYGRLAHRLLEASPHIGPVWCIDAVPRSTFLCEYYLRHRGLADRSTVINLTGMGAALSPGQIDLAVNVHSFSEMPRRAVAGWVQWLVALRVPAVFVVPNDRDRVMSLEEGGGREDCEDIFAKAGYRRTVAEPTINDAGVRDVLGIHDYFLLFRRGEP